MDSFCQACGNSIVAGEKFCRVCGRAVSGGSPGVPSAGAVASGPPETSGKAITSLICSLLFFIPLAFIAAIVFGHMGLSEIKKSTGRLKGKGLAIAGLVLGYVWVVFISIILIVAAIAIPNSLRARIAANESSAVYGVRRLVNAETTYAFRHPDLGLYMLPLRSIGRKLNCRAAVQRTKKRILLRTAELQPFGGRGRESEIPGCGLSSAVESNRCAYFLCR
jgi:hypothetical protein